MASTPVATRRPPARSTRPAARGGAARPRPSTRPRTRARRRKRSRRGLPKLGPAGWLLVAVAALVVLAWSWNPPATPDAGPADAALTTGCRVPGSETTLTQEQYENASTIARVAYDRQLPDRAVALALATAMQESRLRNLDYGDRDSLGLFQQRPSQGWGTPAQVQDPVYAAGKFYDHLVRLPDWQTGNFTLTADAVQRSAFPLAYGRWSSFAERWAPALRSGDVDCT